MYKDWRRFWVRKVKSVGMCRNLAFFLKGATPLESIGESEFISVASLSLSEDNMTFSLVMIFFRQASIMTDVSSFKMLNLKG